MRMCRKTPDFKGFFGFWAEKVLYQIHEENRLGHHEVYLSITSAGKTSFKYVLTFT